MAGDDRYISLGELAGPRRARPASGRAGQRRPARAGQLAPASAGQVAPLIPGSMLGNFGPEKGLKVLDKLPNYPYTVR